MSRIKEYIDWVNDNPDKTGKLVKLAVKRFNKDLKRKDIYFDWDYVDSIIEITESLLCFWESEWAGKPVYLYPFQAFIVGNILGWKKKDGMRRFRKSYIQIARKNGKTTLLDIIIWIHLFLDDEKTPQVLVGANNEDQSRICTNSLARMITKSPAFKEYLDDERIKLYKYKDRYNTISLNTESKSGIVMALSADADTKDGYNPSLGAIDEYHEAVDDSLYNVIVSGMGMRLNPSMITITTAGFNKNGVCYQKMRKSSIDILEGIKEDDSFFTIIFEPDKTDDWKDPNTWTKSNPMLIHIPTLKTFLQTEITKAINEGGSTEVNFITKNLNTWTDSESTWLPHDIILKNNHETEYKHLPCYVGIDLSKSVDLSIAIFIFIGEVITVKCLCWIPESKLQESEADYHKWRNEGFVRVHSGNVLDHDKIAEDILLEMQGLDIKKIGFDSRYAYGSVISRLHNGGYQDLLIPVGQGFFLSSAYREIEQKVNEFKFNFLHNPVLYWNFSNVVMEIGVKGDIAANKKKSKNKIDIVTCLATGYHEFMQDRKISFAEPSITILN